ncbi:hybrid sensor histidine kinase/response regulator [Puteibacter caeruleilacunae]|nr:hybrid sensor histidine kinase/response regulator [Puteibacter caeruleilacunae]
MRPFFLLIILCCIGLRGASNDTDFTFRRMSPPGGLSSESVNAIIQDQQDIIWVGTNHGLLKYNIQSKNLFSNEPDKSKCLKQAVILSLAIDSNGKLWVAMLTQLCVLDKSTQLFKRFNYHDDSGSIATPLIYYMANDRHGNIWIADQFGIGKINSKTGYIKRLTIDNSETPVHFYFDIDNTLWIGTQQGSIYKVTSDNWEPELFLNAQNNKVTSIYKDNQHLWVGYTRIGLKQYNLDGSLVKDYNFNKAIGVSHDIWDIRKVIKDQDGTLWVSTYHGLFAQKKGDKLTWIDNYKKEGLPHSSIFEIYEDRQNGIWIGTWAGGLSYYHKANNQFINYSHTKDPSSISNNIVSCFTQDQGDQVYVGTEKGGLNRFHKKTGTFSQVSLNQAQSSFNIKHQCIDKMKGHWVATKDNGLWYKAVGESKYKHFTYGPEDGKHISGHEVFSLCPTETGVWIGTQGEGLNFYNYKTRKISFQSTLFPEGIPNKSLFIRPILVDSHSNLWIGTVEDIKCIPFQGNAQNKNAQAGFNGLIYCIKEVGNGQIWIGTKTGLKIYDPQNDTFTPFHANQFLKDESVYGILEDHNHHIWITSSNGLILYKPEFKSARKFGLSDGIQGLWFNPQAVFMDQDSLLYFGGTNGFTTVAANKVKINIRPPKVMISDIIINNNKHLYPFFTSIDSTDNKLILSPEETTLRFDFTSDNYLLPEKNRFQYRLVNYYDEWIESDQTATALFANLSWGTYIFEVKSCNNDGIWCLKPARVQIIISRPLYATNIAYIVYFILLSIAIYFLIRTIKVRAKLRNEILIQTIQHKQEEQLNELKIGFFTNVSHEFKTPLSLISGPAKSLTQADNLTETQKGMVDIIQRNSERLLMLINQIIDFRKMEKGKEKLNLSAANIVSFLKERSLHFSFDAQSRSISFVQSYPDKPINMEFDPEKLDYIIFNLLSNSFKFTPNGKQIKLSIVNGNQLQYNKHYQHHASFGELHTTNVISILVEDEGAGIDAEDLKNVFDRFEQGKTLSKNSSGIGLSLCRDFTLLHKGSLQVYTTPGKGSCFVVQLPIEQESENIYIESYTPTLVDKAINLDAIESTEKSTAMVLIVEDNPDLRTYLTSVLKPHYQIKIADNGITALNILQTTAIDIIVSDVMMPEMNGFELCAKVKSDIATSHLPIILLTALSSSSNHITGMQLGADAYITKPFSDDILLSQIDNLLAQREHLRKHFGPKIPTGESANMNGLDNYFLKKLNDIIEEHLHDDKFDIEQLINLIGISRSQLHRKLKTMTNYSTSEYVRVYRLEKGIQLLETGQYNIDEVAHMVGFKTHSYFTRSFKKHYNQSPKEYMAKQKINKE